MFSWWLGDSENFSQQFGFNSERKYRQLTLKSIYANRICSKISIFQILFACKGSINVLFHFLFLILFLLFLFFISAASWLIWRGSRSVDAVVTSLHVSLTSPSWPWFHFLIGVASSLKFWALGLTEIWFSGLVSNLSLLLQKLGMIQKYRHTLNLV